MTQQRETKVFHLGDVLSITTGMQLSPRYMDGIFEIVRYLTGEAPAFEDLGQTMVRCRPYLFAMLPDLESIEVADVEFENWRPWLDEQVSVFGEWIEVTRPLPGEIA